MIHQNPYASPTRSSSQPTNSRPWIMSWLYLAIVLAIAHGLLNWWSVNNVSGGFWVMEGSGSTLMERFADLLTLLLNVPSLVVCYVFGFPPFGFTMPAFAIANSCLYGSTLALLVVYCEKKRRTPRHDTIVSHICLMMEALPFRLRRMFRPRREEVHRLLHIAK